MISPISLHAIAHGLVLSGVSSPCRRAWRACAFARHTAQHAALHSMQPPHVQASSPGRDCRERMREANAEGKIEGCGTTVRVKPVCTWVWGGTRPRAPSCRPQPQRLAGIGNTVCRIRSGALGSSGAAS